MKQIWQSWSIGHKILVAVAATLSCVATVVAAGLYQMRSSYQTALRNDQTLPDSWQAGLLPYRTIGTSPVVAAEAPQVAPEAAGFVVELATVFSQQAAEAQLAALKAKGVVAYYSPFHHKGKVYFRIRYGGVVSRNQGETLAKSLADKVGFMPQVVGL